MDRKLEKKTWNNKRILTIAGITGLIILVGAVIYSTSGKSKLDVDTERITISTITKGPFQEFIPVNGVVMPLTTIFLDATEGGVVEEKYVEDGADLKKGDPILRLSNTDLELSLANQETAVYAEQTQMQISHNNAQQNTITKLNTMADVENTFKEAERVYKLDKHLYEQKAIGLQEYQSAKNMYDYQVNRYKLAKQILSQDTALVKQQASQSKEQYAHMKTTLELMRQKVASLTLRANVDGQLTSMDAEVGQNKKQGEHLGQIDVQSGFKVRVDIDEHYLSRIYTGLKGDFQFADKTYNLIIKKVYTQVKATGSFQVDMQFVGEVPKGIRKGQTLQVRLALSEERVAVLVPKGGFYQQTGGNWIFKVSEDGKRAYKVNIQLGMTSPDYYVVTQGLNPGDKVITSSYETYGDIQELVLKK
ncbi:HlyD family efflux transporter periplasmic adaptor subunit [Mucilaginibacter sabulilitoris]|uniref:HlyD family efflux transporter periplasmic adaptor subunit n=1 Tax=Mucilaginibacter sabulilitoris TaxID=1173583 RepID=A0ABZ0TH84_9SPHI|nr:HlyD family efflux transporter periplasmic adaptor subunit [Mucilaginibacter sabulilitoris]WPU91069.1 HlyD family efflux transporter periplasmic adaptor subunit [Mucilaginibacter sabulilitoris]